MLSQTHHLSLSLFSPTICVSLCPPLFLSSFSSSLYHSSLSFSPLILVLLPLNLPQFPFSGVDDGVIDSQAIQWKPGSILTSIFPLTRLLLDACVLCCILLSCVLVVSSQSSPALSLWMECVSLMICVPLYLMESLCPLLINQLLVCGPPLSALCSRWSSS